MQYIENRMPAMFTSLPVRVLEYCSFANTSRISCKFWSIWNSNATKPSISLWTSDATNGCACWTVVWTWTKVVRLTTTTPARQNSRCPGRRSRGILQCKSDRINIKKPVHRACDVFCWSRFLSRKSFRILSNAASDDSRSNCVGNRLKFCQKVSLIFMPGVCAPLSVFQYWEEM